jgi:hypothetical protein
MRALTITFSALILILITTEVTAMESGRQPARSYSCKLITGYGTAIGRGSSQAAARDAARELCGSKMIDQYYASRGHISDDAADEIITSCVNRDCE